MVCEKPSMKREVTSIHSLAFYTSSSTIHRFASRRGLPLPSMVRMVIERLRCDHQSRLREFFSESLG